MRRSGGAVDGAVLACNSDRGSFDHLPQEDPLTGPWFDRALSDNRKIDAVVRVAHIVPRPMTMALLANIPTVRMPPAHSSGRSPPEVWMLGAAMFRESSS